jgi:glycosyltransferase involved in cell wall biosynthesis
MFVRNDLKNDSRVWKEAALLSAKGWGVRLVGVRSPQTVHRERIDNIDIVRVPVQSIDSRILKPLFGGERLEFAGANAAAPAAGKPAARPGPKAVLRKLWAPVHEELLTREFTRQALRVVGESPSGVYHGHDLNAMRPAFSARRKWGGKVVFDAHEFFSERNFYRKPGPREHERLRREEASACKNADACITVSHGIAEELERRYRLPERPTVVMNCPVSKSFSEPAKPLAAQLGISGKVLLYIGLVTFHRGIEQTIAAIAEQPDWHLALVGPVQRGYQAELEKRAREMKLGDRLHFMGTVPSEEVPAVAAGADAALVLIQNICLSYYYCSPNKLFEALAAGLPVVASDFPDLSRVLQGKDVGVVCSPDDPKSIAAAIEKVLGWPHESVREKARKLATEFTWEREGERLVQVYEKIASRKNYEHETV